MNIFAIDSNPQIAARHLCDQHVVKMITETSQILASAVIRHGAKPHIMPLTKSGTPAKGGYHNHPSTIWAGNNQANFNWTLIHGFSLCREYTARYGKVHFCEQGMIQYYRMRHSLPLGDLEKFSIAINQDQKCRQAVDDFDSLHAVTQYRLYYAIDKTFARWKRNKPDWIDHSIDQIINKKTYSFI